MTSSEFILKRVQCNQSLVFRIQAFNLAGAGPSTSEILAKTLDFDVPNTPKIRALKANTTSIELTWSVQGEEPISGYVISYKPATQSDLSVDDHQPNVVRSSDPDVRSNHNSFPVASVPGIVSHDSIEWRTIKIDLADHNASDSVAWFDVTTLSPQPSFYKYNYVLADLRCGTKYFIYVNAYNQAGQGDPSEVILSRTDGNVPISPENAQDFVTANSTEVLINLSQWKKLGCPIESFDVEYRKYGDVDSNQKFTYRLSSSNGILSSSYVDNKDLSGSNPQGRPPSMLTYTIHNLIPGSWYELIVKANTESGYSMQDYIFSTLRMDGSTVAPLTMKAIDEWNQKNRRLSGSSSGPLHTLRSSLFAQLHYIVPVFCTLFILFLVTIVVCIIQTNQRNQFLLQFVSGRHNRHKVSTKLAMSNNSTTGTSSSGPSTALYSSSGGSVQCTDGTGSMMMMHEGSVLDSSNNGNDSGEFCNRDHIFTALGKLCASSTVDDLKCHSGCDHHQHSSNHVKLNGTEATMKMTGGYQQYPLYSLPIPYATSTLQNNKLKDQMECIESIYGTSKSNGLPFTKNQLNEMYCENEIPLPPPPPLNGQSISMEINQQQQHHQSPMVSGQLQQQPNFATGRHPSHQYELPFVFGGKPAAITSSTGIVKPHNESTAF